MVVREALLDPTGRTGGEADARRAPRLVPLRGARLGLLNSTKPNSAVVLEQVAALLEQEEGVASVTMFSKRSFAVPAEEKVLSDIAETCDYAIAGVGD